MYVLKMNKCMYQKLEYNYFMHKLDDIDLKLKFS